MKKRAILWPCSSDLNITYLQPTPASDSYSLSVIIFLTWTYLQPTPTSDSVLFICDCSSDLNVSPTQPSIRQFLFVCDCISDLNVSTTHSCIRQFLFICDCSFDLNVSPTHACIWQLPLYVWTGHQIRSEFHGQRNDDRSFQLLSGTLGTDGVLSRVIRRSRSSVTWWCGRCSLRGWGRWGCPLFVILVLS